MTQLASATSPDAPPAVLGSLSPSRAADFKACPLLYRFRCVDRLPEAPSSAATRGTLVHAVLEALFELPARQRTLGAARGLLPAAWARLREVEPQVDTLFADDIDGVGFRAFLESAQVLLGNYFRLENPADIEPAERELAVEVVVDGVRLRGIIDRLDIAPTGESRVVDYKTGASPREAYEQQALFQLKFYALLLWRSHGVVPRQLRLIYLADTDMLTYEPELEELLRFERTVLAIWAAIWHATAIGDFQPNPGRLCEWCDHHDLCPAFGGTPPAFPVNAVLTDPRDDLPSTAVPSTRVGSSPRRPHGE